MYTSIRGLSEAGKLREVMTRVAIVGIRTVRPLLEQNVRTAG